MIYVMIASEADITADMIMKTNKLLSDVSALFRNFGPLVLFFLFCFFL